MNNELPPIPYIQSVLLWHCNFATLKIVDGIFNVFLKRKYASSLI